MYCLRHARLANHAVVPVKTLPELLEIASEKCAASLRSIYSFFSSKQSDTVAVTDSIKTFNIICEELFDLYKLTEINKNLASEDLLINEELQDKITERSSITKSELRTALETKYEKLQVALHVIMSYAKIHDGYSEHAAIKSIILLGMHEEELVSPDLEANALRIFECLRSATESKDSILFKKIINFLAYLVQHDQVSNHWKVVFRQVLKPSLDTLLSKYDRNKLNIQVITIFNNKDYICHLYCIWLLERVLNAYKDIPGADHLKMLNNPLIQRAFNILNVCITDPGLPAKTRKSLDAVLDCLAKTEVDSRIGFNPGYKEHLIQSVRCLKVNSAALPIFIEVQRFLAHRVFLELQCMWREQIVSLDEAKLIIKTILIVALQDLQDDRIPIRPFVGSTQYLPIAQKALLFAIDFRLNQLRPEAQAFTEPMDRPPIIPLDPNKLKLIAERYPPIAASPQRPEF